MNNIVAVGLKSICCHVLPEIIRIKPLTTNLFITLLKLEMALVHYLHYQTVLTLLTIGIIPKQGMNIVIRFYS